MSTTPRASYHGPSTETGLPDDAVRRRVAAQYFALKEQRASDTDKRFIGGHELSELDSRLVILNEDAGEHPRTWGTKKKAWSTTVIALFGILSPFASTIFAPSIHLIMADLDIRDSTVGALMVSIFTFAYAVGPLVLSPVSELYGRAVVQHVGNLVFMAFSLGGGFSKTATQLALCRFFAGIGGSATIAIIGGVATDLWDPEARAKVQGLIMLGPILGPILGPVCGGWMSERLSWRWTMWVPSAASAVLAVMGALFLRETYAPVILQRKLAKVKVSKADEQYYTVLDLATRPSNTGYIITQFVRPVVYLCVDPALFLNALYYSIVFGTLYLVIVTFADVFSLGYHHSVGIVGTEFLAIGIGVITATVITIKAQDMLFSKGKRARKGHTPESRLLSGLLGPLICAGGLFIYGFSAFRTHFMVPLVGIFVFSMGVTNVMMAIQVYIIDGFDFAASAFASISFFRFALAGAFPLFGSKLFDTLGVDWGVGLLAFISLGVGLFYVPLLYVFGRRLREVGARHMREFVGEK